MARPVVGNPFDNQIPTVAPTATPVDTFVRGVEKRSTLGSLADTLSRFSQKAAPILQRREQEAAERELLEGQRLYQENRIAMGDAVRTGLIEEGASPYLRKGYRISQMNTLAARYATELEAKLVTEKLYTNGDPERIESYIADFQKQFLDTNGLNEFSSSELAEHFGLSAAKTEEAFRASWGSKHVEWQKEENYRAFEEEVATYVTSIIRTDMTDEEEDIAKAKMANWLQEQAKLRRVDGQENKRVADSIVSGILFAATQSKDPEVIDILLSTKLGTDVIGKSVENMEKVYNTKVTIARLLEADATKISEELKAEHEQLAGEVSANVFANIHGTNYDPVFVNTEIARLVRTKDEKLVNEAITLMDYQNKVNKLINESVMTPELLIEADALMEAALDRSSARAAALTFVQANGLGKQDLANMMSNWTQNFAPSGDTFGLKFNVGTTPEGALIKRLKDVALGSELSEDYASEEKRDTFRRARILAQRKIRNYVSKYQAENEVDAIPEDVLEEFIFTLEGEIFTLISEEAISASPELINRTAETVSVPNF